MTSPPAHVILLTGPSGSGKTSLAARTGLPVLSLDHFYRSEQELLSPDHSDAPLLPDGRVDWDSPRSWDAEAALTAITTLARTGRATVPVYDLAASARTGHEELGLGGAPLFVADGIFAARLVDRCRQLGVLADALCLRGSRGTTFRRRLLRDMRESRKPLPVLVRRGWRLMRAEPAIVAEQEALGARACTRDEALARINALRARATAADVAPAPTPGPRPDPASVDHVGDAATVPDRAAGRHG